MITKKDLTIMQLQKDLDSYGTLKTTLVFRVYVLYQNNLVIFELN